MEFYAKQDWFEEKAKLGFWRADTIIRISKYFSGSTQCQIDPEKGHLNGTFISIISILYFLYVLGEAELQSFWKCYNTLSEFSIATFLTSQAAPYLKDSQNTKHASAIYDEFPHFSHLVFYYDMVLQKSLTSSLSILISPLKLLNLATKISSALHSKLYASSVQCTWQSFPLLYPPTHPPTPLSLLIWGSRTHLK